MKQSKQSDNSNDKFLDEWLECGALMNSDNGHLVLGWGERQWLESQGEFFDGPCFYFPDFFLKNQKTWFVHQHHLEIDAQRLLHLLTTRLVAVEKTCKWHHPYSQVFKEQFDRLQEEIVAKKLQKAVPYVFQRADVSMSFAQLTHSLCGALRYQMSRRVFLYGFWGASEGMLGATPELLFTLKDSTHIETMACAGTRSKGSTRLPLMEDRKELKEHRLVVEGIKGSLSSLGKVKIGTTHVLDLPQLEHLVTAISVDCDNKPSFSDVVEALHPTPALGASPREAGRHWLKQYQQLIGRNRFGAPVGFVWSQKHLSCCYVAIRNVQWDQHQMYLGAGCGVIAESQYEREWDEINLKLQSIKEILAL